MRDDREACIALVFETLDRLVAAHATAETVSERDLNAIDQTVISAVIRLLRTTPNPESVQAEILSLVSNHFTPLPIKGVVS